MSVCEEHCILEKAGHYENWIAFLDYKIEKQHLTRREEKEFRDFVERKAYLPICEQWMNGRYPSQLPLKRLVNKQGTRKKRVVYTFPGDEGIFMKFIAFHLFDFDACLCPNCYAFRRSIGVKDAIRRIRENRSLRNKYCLKVDISNYFNSIDIDILLQKLSFIKDKDLQLYRFFERVLREGRVLENNQVVADLHGAMAGTPISPFFANIYLRDVDWWFYEQKIPYFRYSDDIILFANTLEELEQLQQVLYAKIAELKLSVNPDKVHISAPKETWEFLGFGYHDGQIDLSEITIRKMKAKIRRKSEALRRWQRKKGLTPDKAAIGLIHAMNRKFYGAGKRDGEDAFDGDDFTWSRWFFPNLTVDTGLKIIDTYFQQYIRYTVTGRHYKGNYRIRYQTMKDWGYRNLVHEYYEFRKNAEL